MKNGLQVFDHTEIADITHERNSVKLQTSDGCIIECRKLVIACGYESQRYIPKKMEQFHSTYAIASEPIRMNEFWFKNAVIWETATPYLYLRTTKDHRIIIGGKDDPFSNPKKRDSLLDVKARHLEEAFKKLFPLIPFKIDFQWAGTFASTKDGLPFIGSIPQRLHTYFTLGYGGNGITFSVIAANLIRDSVSGKSNPDKNIFSFDR